MSFRTDKGEVKQLDALAKQQRRDRTQLINEAIENYLDIQRWHLEEIEAGIREADAGIFASTMTSAPFLSGCCSDRSLDAVARLFQE